MLMNEHITEQQTHIWRLLLLLPEFFYPVHEQLSMLIMSFMRKIGTRSVNAHDNRELCLNMISLLIWGYWKW